MNDDDECLHLPIESSPKERVDIRGRINGFVFLDCESDHYRRIDRSPWGKISSMLVRKDLVNKVLNDKQKGLSIAASRDHLFKSIQLLQSPLSDMADYHPPRPTTTHFAPLPFASPSANSLTNTATVLSSPTPSFPSSNPGLIATARNFPSLLKPNALTLA